MVPLSLRLRNFMCYRGDTPPLLLDGVHVACLNGQNGHGKSALLDAMTWALWGQARAKADDDLIYQNQTEMEVELEFRAADGGRYRVIRKRSRPRSARGAGQTGLELHVLSESGEARPITEGTVRETQREIQRRIRLDYETFVNSAYLQQGRADAFTLKSAADRKQVLGDILGLSYYDELEEQCRGLAREAESRLSYHTRELVELDREIAGREDLEALLRQAEEELERVQAEHDAQELVTAGLRQRMQALAMQVLQMDEIDRRIAANQSTLERYWAEVRTEQAHAARYRSVLDRSEEITRGAAELLAARRAVEDGAQRLALLRPLEQEAHRVERAIAAEQARTEQEAQILRAEMDGLRPKAEAMSQLAAGLQQIDQEQRELDHRQSNRDAAQAQVLELSNQEHHLTETNVRLRDEMVQLRTKLDELEKASGGVCPFCGTEFGENGKAHVEAKFREDGGNKRDQYRANEHELRRIADDLKKLQEDLAGETERLARSATDLTTRRAWLTLVQEEGQRAQRRLGEAGPLLAQLEAAQENSAAAAVQRLGLAEVRIRIAEVSYDEARHAAGSQRAQELASFEHLAREVEDAERLLEQSQERLTQAQAMALHFEGLAGGDRQRRDTIAAALVDRTSIERDASVAEEALAYLRSRAAQQGQALGGLRQQQERLDTLVKVRKDKREAQTEARGERDVYGDLAAAFGKRGIQALIIETALPEIQNEANQILGRMTDNRMSVTLETQRQTRAGKVMETLDIRIGDELGTRDYDLFSGGEAFRVNFALRIALSRLLARRAGAPMPTLIVDEGFGTQDSAGREKLVEVINAIQDDFERILIITHIDELKDLFSVRIEVVKTAEGSTATLVA